MRWKKSAELAGNFLALTLTLGFTALCCVEGGLHGHAIAWLVSVPLCALLLAGRRSAQWWAVIAFFAASIIAGMALAGINLPVLYAPEWNSVVSAAGYLGLILFMFILGLIFEVGRTHAFSKMQTALGELASSNERLVHMNNEKNEFLGIAAHDLKNPLTVIVGSAELMKMTKDPARVEKLTNVIVSAATRMRDLVSNLLDANAIEQGKFISKLEACDIRLLTEECVEHNRTAATKKGIIIKAGTSEGLWAKADRAATMQILDNLISNAVKYSPPNTTVHVHTLPEEKYILVSVRDEGPGINEEDQKKLFQKFTRLTARPTAGESSTGLGLSIVKRLAEAMSGSVQCHSAIGFGATFMLRLPVFTGTIPSAEAVPVKTRSNVSLTGTLPDVHSRN
jgi:signal transduction histidine kinase